MTLKDNHINQLKNEVKNCKTENSNLNNQLNQSTKEIESLSAKKKKYKKEKKDKDKEIFKLSQNVEARDAQVSSLKQQIDTLKVENNTKTDVITNLEKQVQKEKNTTEELRIQNENMAAEIEGHKKKQNDTEEIMKKLSEDFEANSILLDDNEFLSNIVKILTKSINKTDKNTKTVSELLRWPFSSAVRIFRFQNRVH